MRATVDRNTTMSKHPTIPKAGELFEVGKFTCHRCDISVLADPEPYHNQWCRCGNCMTFDGVYTLPSLT